MAAWCGILGGGAAGLFPPARKYGASSGVYEAEPRVSDGFVIFQVHRMASPVTQHQIG